MDRRCGVVVCRSLTGITGLAMLTPTCLQLRYQARPGTRTHVVEFSYTADINVQDAIKVQPSMRGAPPRSRFAKAQSSVEAP